MRPWAVPLLCLVGACGGCEGQRDADVTELGALSLPAVATGRDGGAAAVIGDRLLWTFGDTLMTVTGADGFTYRSATAGWGSGRGLSLDEKLDGSGAPFQLFPLTDAELDYNRSGGPNERYALWPGSVIPDGSGGALLYFSYLKVHPGTLNYEPLGAGVARLAAGETVAVRQPELLFVTPEPSFAVGGIVAAGFVYLYACQAVPGTLDTDCRVARAPVASATVPAAFAVWTGAGWSADRTTGVAVIHGPPGELSVSFNAHAGTYLAVHSAVFSDEVVYQTAPAPEGPWSGAHHLFNGRQTPGSTNYGAREHPELSTDGGRSLVVSYAHPLGGFRGEVRLALPVLP